jgi:hypothetical protein
MSETPWSRTPILAASVTRESDHNQDRFLINSPEGLMDSLFGQVASPDQAALSARNNSSQAA